MIAVSLDTNNTLFCSYILSTGIVCDILFLLVESDNSHLVVSKQMPMVMCEYSHRTQGMIVVMISLLLLTRSARVRGTLFSQSIVLAGDVRSRQRVK